jgi:hypothetical protein
MKSTGKFFMMPVSVARFSYQKYHFGSILEGHAMDDVGIFKDDFVHFLAIRYILRQFGKKSHFGMLNREKCGKPGFVVDLNAFRRLQINQSGHLDQVNQLSRRFQLAALEIILSD